MLDQRLLPGREEWLRCETPRRWPRRSRALAVRGAPAIGLAAAYGLALAIDGGERCGEERTRPAGRRPPGRCGAARPTAANLGWALRARRLAAADAAGVAPGELRALSSTRPTGALSELGAERFEPGDRALTHCNTGPLATGGYGTALGVLRAAWRRAAEHVWVDETRPLLQGARLTAWELGARGHPVHAWSRTPRPAR